MNKAGFFSDSFFAMGTDCDVLFSNVDVELGKKVFQIVKKEVQQLEKKLNSFTPNSSISNLKKNKIKDWITVDNELWDFLTICFDFYQMSNGAFDIAAAPLFEIWRENEIPPTLQIENAKQAGGFDKVEFDFVNKKIRFDNDLVGFDFGAVQKGFALDVIRPVLSELGIENGIVSFGESSILALGNHPNGEKWPLGIRNKMDVNNFDHVFSASNETVTSSGTIVISDEGELKNKRNIISPETGFPVDEKKVISVKSESAVLGAFLSLTLLILPENDQVLLTEKLKNIEILEVDYSSADDYKTKLTIL